MEEKKHDEIRKGYALIGVLGITVLALLMLVSIAAAAPYAYITNSDDSTVSVIDTATNTVTATVPVGNHPRGVAVNPTATKVYVVCDDYGYPYYEGSISVIDTATNTVTATVKNVGAGSYGIAVSPDGTKVYATCVAGVTVIDTATNTVTAGLGPGFQLAGVAFNPAGTKAYAASEDYPGSVRVIDTATNTVTDLSLTYDSYSAVAVSPDGTKVYVTNSSVVVIDTTTDMVISTVPVGSNPCGIAVTPDGKRVYATCSGSNTVSVIDTTTDMVISTVPVGNHPRGVAVTPDGTRVYVANEGSDTVSVIDIATNQVIDTVNVGKRPIAFGQFIGPLPVLPEIQMTQISTSGSASSPAIYGDRIVWEDSREGESDIYMYNLSTKQEIQISTNGTANAPAIYGDRIVWKDSRNGKSEIYMYDLSTQQESQIPTSEIAYGSCPEIYNDRIVWEGFDEYNISQCIYMYNLSTQQETQIDKNTFPYHGFAIHGDKIVMGESVGDDHSRIAMYDLSTQQTTWPGSGDAVSPDIYGDRIVWQDYRNGDEYNIYPDIYTYDLSTQQEIQITTSGSAFDPHIYGDRIVWVEGSGIYMYDLSNSKETQITTSGSARSPDIYGDRTVWVDGNNIYMGTPAPEPVPPEIQITRITTSGLASSPAIYGDGIVWEDNRNEKSDIYMCDISTQQEIQISTSGTAKSPAIYGDRIGWEDNRNEKSDIYMYDISTQQEIQISTSGTAKSPAIYGDRIGWQGLDANYAQSIFVYDLSTQQETQISNDMGTIPFYGFALHGDKIVMGDPIGFTLSSIVMYNLSTQQKTGIIYTDSYNPDIYGDRIVWEDNRNGDKNNRYLDIYMYDLSTQQETQISTSRTTYDPAIYGDRIVWQDDRDGKSDIYMYDLPTQQETQITTSGSARSPEIYGDRIVWVDGNDIYMGTLSYPSVAKNVQSVLPAVDGSIRDGLDYSKDGIADNIIDNSVVQLLDVERDDMPFEDRGIIEFDISKISGSVTNATLNLSVFSSNGPYPFKVDIFTYTGDGNLDLNDFNSGTHFSTFEYYGEETVQLDVTEFVENMVSSGAKYAAFNFQYVEPSAIPMNGPFVAFNSLEYPPAAKLTIVSEIFNEKPIAVLPVANFTANTTEGTTPLNVQFTDLSTNATEWNWNFGDGATSTEQNPAHTYCAAGNYTVNLTVNNENSTDSKSTTITVLEQPVPPVADFSASPTVGKAPLTVTFTDQSTGSPTSWSWKFGDKIISTAQNPEHIYSKAGKYTVSLTVKNAVGSDTRKISKYITVKK